MYNYFNNNIYFDSNSKEFVFNMFLFIKYFSFLLFYLSFYRDYLRKVNYGIYFIGGKWSF